MPPTLKKAKLNITIDPGTTLEEAAQEAIAISRKFEMPVRFEFGGEYLTASGTDKPADIVQQFDEMEKIKGFRPSRLRPKPMPRKQ